MSYLLIIFVMYCDFWSIKIFYKKKLAMASVTRKNRQMSIKVAQKWKILTPLQKLPKNVGHLGKLIVATGYEKLPKVQ